MLKQGHHSLVHLSGWDLRTTHEQTFTDGVRVKHPAQHMQSFLMFLPAAKRPRKIDPAAFNAHLLLRYLQVQEYIFPGVRHPSVASDGVRVSGKDAVYLCIGGCHSESFRAVWGLMAPCGNCTQSQAHKSDPPLPPPRRTPYLTFLHTPNYRNMDVRNIEIWPFQNRV
jgi:hypothetical protein